MTTPAVRRAPALGVALLLALTLARADDPKPDPKEKKAQQDEAALPKGAKLRLGDPRVVFRFPPQFSLLPPDYKVFVVPDGIDALRRYDVTTGLPVDPPRAMNSGSWQVVISADGKRWASTATGPLTVREVATGKEVRQLKLPMGLNSASVFNAPSVALSADGKVAAQGGQAAGGKGGIAVWDVEKGDVLFQTGTQANGPALPVLSPDGKLVAVRSTGFGGIPPGGRPEDNPAFTLAVYETDGGKERFTGRVTPGGFQGMTAVVFSPDGSLVAASCGDGVIDLFDAKTGKARPPILGRAGQGMRVAFSPDGKTLAAVGIDGAIQRWAAADGKPLDTTEAPAAGITMVQGLTFAGDDRVLAWGNLGQSAVVWEAPSGKVLTPVPEHTTGIKSIGFAAGGKEVVTAGIDGRIVRWDAATGKPTGHVELRPGRAGGYSPGYRPPVNLTPDAARAITTVVPTVVFDVATGREEFALPRGQLAGASTSAIPSADASKVIVTSVPYDRTKSGTCTVWDLVARRKLGEVELPAGGGVGYPPGAAVSPSGERLVTATYLSTNNVGGQQTLVVTGWDLKTGKKLGQVEDVNARGLAFVAAAGESYAVVHSGSGRLRAYDYEAGKGGDEFEAGKQFAESVAGPVVFAPDRKRFVSSGPGADAGSYPVRVHEWPTGKVLHTFAGHRGPVSAITFSADGKTLATGSADATVLLWDLGEVK